MKQLLLVCMLLGGISASAQTASLQRDTLMLKARLMLSERSQHYNPEQAYEILSKKATEGNSEAMNAIGMMYIKGTAVTMDEKEGLRWIEKAAQAGYTKAWYNLGMMYKNGIGTEQDFGKAFSDFVKGSELKDASSYYGRGYMYFKGLGTEQSYEKAFLSFQKGGIERNANAMYMMGICYRNGYGTVLNLDSARYWLIRASRFRHDRAIEELTSLTAENTGIKEAPQLQTTSSSQADFIDVKTGYKKVSHYFPAGKSEGEYAGYAIQFDWSGKHIIATPELKMKLKITGKEFEAEWQERDEAPVSLTGIITDTSVVFKNAVYTSFDHYNKKQPNQLYLKEAVLQIAKSDGQTFITGNIKRYSLTHKEPEKPVFIMLVNTEDKQSLLLADNKSEVDSVNFRQYPNPFINSFQLSYTLKTQNQVSIIISSVLTGKIVYNTTPQLQNAGEHSQTVALNAPSGYYVVTLNYGNRLKSATIFKQ
jgi:TPR repeat protein